MCSKPSSFSKPLACNHSILMPVNSLRTSGVEPSEPLLVEVELVVHRWCPISIVALAELHQVLFRHADAAPLGHGFVSRRYGCLENGLPLLDATACSSLLRRRLRTGSVTLSSRDPVAMMRPGAAFFGCPGASKSALRRCGAGWFTDRVLAPSGALTDACLWLERRTCGCLR